MDNGASSYRRFLEGDDNGFVEIVRDYKDGLIFYLNSFTNNIYIAEDLAEDTFVKLGIKKPRYTKKASFKTWLYAIGRNVAIDYMRKNHKLHEISIDDCTELICDEDFAKIMKKSVHSVETLVYRARLSLKSELEKEGFNYENL